MAYTSSDTIAYPLALAAMASAVFAIDEPRRRNQVTFFVFATLATLPASSTSCSCPRNRRGGRRSSGVNSGVAIESLLIALAPVGVAFVVGSFGFYVASSDTSLNGNFVEVVLPSGVPTCDRGRSRHRPGRGRGDPQTDGRSDERGFAVMAATMTVLLLAEATAHAANSQEFKERYLVLVIRVARSRIRAVCEARRRPPDGS